MLRRHDQPLMKSCSSAQPDARQHAGFFFVDNQQRKEQSSDAQPMDIINGNNSLGFLFIVGYNE